MTQNSISNTQRKAIYRRDGFQCALCSSTAHLQLHHVIHRGQGGGNHPHNLVTLCADCHAMAHGIPLRDCYEGMTQDDMEQAIVEYLSDYYSDMGEVWCPWKRAKEQGGH